MEFWSTGVLRLLRIVPGDSGVGGAFGAVFGLVYPGPKAFGPELFCVTISWSRIGISPKSCRVYDSLLLRVDEK